MKPKPAEPDPERIKACPYRGLVPYFEGDADYFFGRQSDTQIIVANCTTTRVTLFYGASGVGKSSVLYAGVMRELDRRARANLERRNCPECVGVAFSSWRDDSTAGLLDRVEATMRKLLPADWLPEIPPRAATLAGSLRTWTEFMQSDLVLLLDQFEEYFLYRDAHDTTFTDELVAVVNDPDLRVNVLISLREDALARLDTLKANIPALFANGLRLDHLTMDSARLAIEGPLKLYNDRLPPSAPRANIEPGLADAVLNQVRAGRVRLRQSGTGVVRAGSAIAESTIRVEAPYLQMVIMRLWREDIARGGNTLRLSTLNALGGAEKILRTHLDVVMAQLPASEQMLAAQVFHQLVTRSGTKIAHYVSDLAAFAQAPVADVARMCELLVDWKARVLRDVTPPGMDSKRYEIFHDLLAAPILDWRQRHVDAERQRAARKKWGTRIAAAFLVCAAIAGAIFYQQEERKKKEFLVLEEQKKAELLKLEEQRKAEEKFKDSYALRLAVADEQLKSTQQTEIVQSVAKDELARKEMPTEIETPIVAVGTHGPAAVLREASLAGVAEYTTDKVDNAHKGDVWNADYATPDPTSPLGRSPFLITAGRDKTAFVMDLMGDNDFYLQGHEKEVNAALLNPNAATRATGWFAATASDDMTARVWKSGHDAPFAELKRHTAPLSGLAWSRDGRWLVTASKDRTAIIWDLEPPAGGPPQPAHVLNQGAGSIWQPALVESTGGSWLVTPCNDGKAYFYSFPDGKFLRSFDHDAAVRRAAISPDGSRVLTAGADGRAVLWNRETGESLCTAVHKDAVRDVAFDKAGRYFATGSSDGTAQVWDVQMQQGVVALKGHTAPIFSIAFTPAGPGLVTTSWDRTARIWNFDKEPRCVAICTGHANVIWSVKFNTTGGNFCTTSADGTTRIWVLEKIAGTEALRPK